MAQFRTLTQFATSLLVTSALVTLSGCATDEESTQDVAPTTTEEALYKTGTRWPENMGRPKASYINVCYRFDSTVSTDTDKAAARTFAGNMKRWVENTWGRAADLSFGGWGECGSSVNGKMVVNLMKGGRSGSAVGFQGDRAPTQMHLAYDAGEAHKMVAHEFGHALGFAHEFNRLDFPCSPGSEGCMPCTSNDFCTSKAGDYGNYGNVCINNYCRFDGGDKLANPSSADRESIMAEGYVRNRIYWDTSNVASPSVLLSTYDVLGAQKVYGRKPAGSLVGIGGRCADVSGGTLNYGSPLIAWPCTNGPNDRWSWDPKSQHLASLLTAPGGIWTPSSAPMCLNVSGGTVNPSGSTPLISWGCGNYSNEKFQFDGVQIRGMGNMCLTATSTSAGAAIDVQRCQTAAQNRSRWNLIPRTAKSGDFILDYTGFQLAGTDLCMTVTGFSIGSQLSLQSCSSSAYQQSQAFNTNQGLFSAALSPNLCMNVLGGSDAVGQRIGLWNACSTDYINSVFHLVGPIKAMGQCVDMLGGQSYDGAPMGMYPCVSTAPNHEWDYYFL